MYLIDKIDIIFFYKNILKIHTMETINVDELITSLQVEKMCKHLDKDDINRLMNSFMDELDSIIQQNGWLLSTRSKYNREIVKSRLYCFMSKIPSEFNEDINDLIEDIKESIEDIKESIEHYITSCSICQPNDVSEYAMVSAVFI